MEFTYRAYGELLKKLREHGYRIADYRNWEGHERCVILRHDIDNDIEKAAELAAFEGDGGVFSTYFVLVTSDFYNVFSKKSVEGLRRIRSYGHEIGLHFDEMRYPDIAGDMNAVRDKIRWEARILGEALECEVRTVSMHRPSKDILEADLKVPGMVNSYGQTYFREFKYLSDSRCRWREPVEAIIESEQFQRLHILTHGFWYQDMEEAMEDTVRRFVNGANWERYEIYKDNFTDLFKAMSPDEIMGLHN